MKITKRGNVIYLEHPRSTIMQHLLESEEKIREGDHKGAYSSAQIAAFMSDRMKLTIKAVEDQANRTHEMVVFEDFQEGFKRVYDLLDNNRPEVAFYYLQELGRYLHAISTGKIGDFQFFDELVFEFSYLVKEIQKCYIEREKHQSILI